MGNFGGMVAFITGASSGIGQALARELARRGAHTALLARRVERLEALAHELSIPGRSSLAVECDVTRDGSLVDAAAKVRQAFGKIDIVIANAGFGVVGRVEKLSLPDYRRQFETNVFGVLRTIYATLDDLKKVKGRLVLMGSVNGYIALPMSSAYGMSKFAVRALADSLRYELAGSGVTLTHICPGFVVSEIRQVDNKGKWHPTVKEPVPNWLQMPTEKAARQMVRAIARRTREKIITGHGRLGVFVARHIPLIASHIISLSGMEARGEPNS